MEVDVLVANQNPQDAVVPLGRCNDERGCPFVVLGVDEGPVLQQEGGRLVLVTMETTQNQLRGRGHLFLHFCLVYNTLYIGSENLHG